MNKKINIFHIIRNIISGLFIFTGFCGVIAGSFLAGIFMMLSGISLSPIFYTKIKLKYIQIILPLILIITSIVFMPQNKSDSKVTETDTNITQENRDTEISSLVFDELKLELDIKNTKNIILKFYPENANVQNLEYCTSNNEIANLEKTEVTNDENKITLNVKPIAEGSCEIFAKSINGIESNKVEVKIIDNEKMQAEEQFKRESEEQAKKEAEEQAKKETEEKKQSQITSSSSQSTKQQSAAIQKNSNSNNSNGKAVYRTPKGERYHYDPDCGGKNSYQTTWEAVKAAGLTPCKKCVH